MRTIPRARPKILSPSEQTRRSTGGFRRCNKKGVDPSVEDAARSCSSAVGSALSLRTTRIVPREDGQRVRRSKLKQANQPLNRSSRIAAQEKIRRIRRIRKDPKTRRSSRPSRQISPIGKSLVKCCRFNRTKRACRYLT